MAAAGVFHRTHYRGGWIDRWREICSQIKIRTPEEAVQLRVGNRKKERRRLTLRNASISECIHLHDKQLIQSFSSFSAN